MTRVGRLLAAHPWIAYAVLAALAYPILEMLVSGARALQYAHDVFDDDVPRLFSIAADWAANGPVLWDPHLTAGNALVAQFALPPLAPDVLLSFVLPPFAAYAANAALMTFAAGTSMHVFLRDSLRLPAVACFFGGIIATFAFWHYIYGYAALLLPLVLWTTDRALSDRWRQRDVLGAILVAAFLLLSSQVQIVIIDGAVAAAWVLVTRQERRARPTRFAGLVAIWAVAFAIAAPVIATQVVALPASQRTIWNLEFLDPVADTLPSAAQLYSRVLVGVPLGAIGGSADIYGTYFLGALGLPMLVAGVVAPRTDARQRLLLVLLVALPILDLIAPLAIPLQERVPLLQSFQFVRVRHLLPVVLAINAAIGVAWLASPDPIGRLGQWRRALGAIGLVAVALALIRQAYEVVRHVRNPGASALARDGWLLDLAAVVGGTVLATLLVIRLFQRTGLPRRAVPPAAVLTGGLAFVLLAGLAGERFAYARSERMLAPDARSTLGTWADRVSPTRAQRFIAAQPGGGRVLSIGDHANRALVAGLDSVDGYETIYPLRYHELFGALTDPYLVAHPDRYRYFHEWGNRAYAFGPDLDMEVADLLGVRWLYARGQALDDPALQPRFTDGDVTVYENSAAFPRSFIAHGLQVLPDRAAVTDAVASASVADLRDRVYLAAPDVPASGTSTPAAGSGAAEATDRATIEHDGIDRISVRTSAAAPGVLVLADTWTPDWTADVDGTPAPVLAVDGALRGVEIPAGDHVVTFRYRPVATYAGIVAAAVAGLLLAGWLLLGRVSPRGSTTRVERLAGGEPRAGSEPGSPDPPA